MVAGGEVLWLDGEEVGTINSPCYSHRLGKSLALAHVKPTVQEGAVLKVAGDEVETTARIVPAPIHDPEKLKTHS